jgi:hypothetical protein
MEEPNILIKTALHEAVQKVNEGMTPTEALKKVASDLDLNPNFIQRTGEALNVALHYKHFKTASDRSHDFEIADIPQAVQENFTIKEKTAAEYVSEHFPESPQNDTVFNYTRMLNNPAYKRAFLEISGATETHEAYPTTLGTVLTKSANYVQRLTKQADEAEVAKVAAEIELNSTFSCLCDEFKKDAGYRTVFEEFESQVFAKHGEASVPYLDLLYKTAKISEERGVHDSGYMMFQQCKEAALFDQLINAGVKVVLAEKQAAEAFEDLSFESSYLQSCNRMLGKKAEKKEESEEGSSKHEAKETSEEEAQEEEREESPEPEDPVLAEIKKKASDKSYTVAATYSQDPVLAEAMQKEAFFGGLMNIGKLMAGPIHDLAHEHASQAFSAGFKHSPATGVKPNLTLENMERKLLLQELMMTDSILSKVNPVKVARAFEQLMRLSPEISKEKEVVRAELRAMVASQALSKYDADLMTKLDSGMLKRRVATHQFNTGHTENFRF